MLTRKQFFKARRLAYVRNDLRLSLVANSQPQINLQSINIQKSI